MQAAALKLVLMTLHDCRPTPALLVSLLPKNSPQNQKWKQGSQRAIMALACAHGSMGGKQKGKGRAGRAFSRRLSAALRWSVGMASDSDSAALLNSTCSTHPRLCFAVVAATSYAPVSLKLAAAQSVLGCSRPPRGNRRLIMRLQVAAST